MIDELMIHGRTAGRQATARCRSVRPARRRFRPVSFAVESPAVSAAPAWFNAGLESETSLAPDLVAQSVCEEVVAWLGLSRPLPLTWVVELVERAHTLYSHNEAFRRRLRRQGNGGRDYLWMFMRHWLAAMLKKRRPELFAELPADFGLGRDLPPRRHREPITCPYFD